MPQNARSIDRLRISLNWNPHTQSLIKRISKNIFLLSKLKRYTSVDNLKLFFNAHIMSHINYASTIYDGCSKETHKQLNSIHRRAIKHLNSKPAKTTDDKLKRLKILPLEKQFELNKTLLVHKIYYNKTPSYLSDIIQKTPERYNSKNAILPLPRIDLFKTSLSFSGTLLWNKLPNDLKIISSEITFKRRLFELLINENRH